MAAEAPLLIAAVPPKLNRGDVDGAVAAVAEPPKMKAEVEGASFVAAAPAVHEELPPNVKEGGGWSDPANAEGDAPNVKAGGSLPASAEVLALPPKVNETGGLSAGGSSAGGFSADGFSASGFSAGGFSAAEAVELPPNEKAGLAPLDEEAGRPPKLKAGGACRGG